MCGSLRCVATDVGDLVTKIQILAQKLDEPAAVEDRDMPALE